MTSSLLRRRVAIQTASIALIGFLIVAAVSAGYLAVSTSHHQEQTTSAESQTITQTVSTTPLTDGALAFSSGVSPDGLQLKILLNSTSVKPLGSVAAFVEVVNTLNHNVTVSVPTLNQTKVIFVWNGYDYVCSDNPSQGLATFAVFKGHYSKGNISSAGAPLKEGAPFIPPCPSLGLFSGGPITFLPNGDQTTIQYFTYNFSLHQHEYAYLKAELNASTGYCGPNPPPENGGNCGLGDGLVGYWNTTISNADILNSSSPAFTYFPPGEYTIAATDLWNQYIFATFHVLPSSGNPVEVFSVVGPIQPFFPALGPNVTITARNVGNLPIASLNASIDRGEHISTFALSFNVTDSHPLLPGRRIQQPELLGGTGFQTGVDYPLTVTGILVDGTRFSFTVDIQVSPPPGQ